MIDLEKIKARKPRLAARCYNTLTECLLLAPKFDYLLDAVMEQMPGPPPGLLDTRRQNAARAIHWLVHRGVLMVHDDHVFECDESSWNLSPVEELFDEPKPVDPVLFAASGQLHTFIRKHGRVPNMLLLSREAAIVLHAELGLWPRGGEPLLGVQHVLGMQPVIVGSFTSATVRVGLVE